MTAEVVYTVDMERNCLLTMPVATNCWCCGRRTLEAHMVERNEEQVILVCEHCCPSCRGAVSVAIAGGKDDLAEEADRTFSGRTDEEISLCP